MKEIGWILVFVIILGLLFSFNDVVECVKLAFNALKNWLVTLQ